MHFIDIIILLTLIAVIYVKLKNVLGTRPTVTKTKISEDTAEKIFDILMKEAKQNEKDAINKGEIIPEVDETELSETDKILRKIPNFNKEKFIHTAKKAFEVILEAFSLGDVATLQDLVSPELFKKFETVIKERQKQGIVAEAELIGFNSAQIENVSIAKNLAHITVKFISEQVNILKNSSDEVIEGDANFIQNITDNWTFEKNLNSTSPKWLLASTKK